MERTVLAYSGGVDASAALAWLARTSRSEIITMTLDMGQGGTLEDVRDRALAGGATRAHVLDVRDEFASGYVLPSLKADAVDEDRRPMATALGRPLIASKLLEVAALEHASAMAYGTRGDDRCLDAAVRLLDSGVAVLPLEWRTPDDRAPESSGDAGVLPAPAPRWRLDANLWGRSFRSLALDGIAPPSEDGDRLMRPLAGGTAAATVDIRFEHGVPTAVNGVPMPLVELVGSLNVIAAPHGVGRLSRIDRRIGDSTAREAGEAPAAVILHAAHSALQAQATTEEVRGFAAVVGRRYAELIDRGEWFSPLRESLDAFVDTVQRHVNGVVHLKLFQGACLVGALEPQRRGDR